MAVLDDPYSQLRARVERAQAERIQPPSVAVVPDASDPVVAEALRRFYRDALWALGEQLNVTSRRNPATLQGFGSVLKRLAVEQGIPGAESIPLPRMSRAQIEDARYEAGR